MKNSIFGIPPSSSRTVFLSTSRPSNFRVLSLMRLEMMRRQSRACCAVTAQSLTHIPQTTRTSRDSRDTKAKVQRHWTHCPVPRRYLSQTVAKFYAHRGTPCIAKRRKGRRRRKPGGERSYKVAERTGFCIPETVLRVSLPLCGLLSLALYGQVAIFDK